MRYFLTNLEKQKIKFISRVDVDKIDRAVLTIYDKYNNVTTTISDLNVYCDNGYLTLTFEHEFTKDFVYLLSVKNSNKLLWQDLCKAI
jgi:hypothetical protein